MPRAITRHLTTGLFCHHDTCEGIRIMCMAGKFVPRRGFTSLESMCKGFTLHFGGPHLTGGVGGQCITTIISVATPHPDVDGLCLVTIISMGLISQGCRRSMPRRLHFDGLHLPAIATAYASPPSFRWATPRRDVDGLPRRMGGPWGPKVPTLGPNDRTADLWGGGRRWTHRIQMRSSLLFRVGAEGVHIGSK